jgi:hypothetical protein
MVSLPPQVGTGTKTFKRQRNNFSFQMYLAVLPPEPTYQIKVKDANFYLL